RMKGTALVRNRALLHSLVSLILVFTLASFMSGCGGAQSAPPAPAPNTGGNNGGGGNTGGGGSGGGTGDGGGTGGGGGTPTDITALNHIIFMFQENRSFDHYFAHLNTYRVNKGWGGPNDVDTLDALSTVPSNPADDNAPLNWTTSNASTVTLDGTS